MFTLVNKQLIINNFLPCIVIFPSYTVVHSFCNTLILIENKPCMVGILPHHYTRSELVMGAHNCQFPDCKTQITTDHAYCPYHKNFEGKTAEYALLYLSDRGYAGHGNPYLLLIAGPAINTTDFHEYFWALHKYTDHTIHRYLRDIGLEIRSGEIWVHKFWSTDKELELMYNRAHTPKSVRLEIKLGRINKWIKIRGASPESD